MKYFNSVLALLLVGMLGCTDDGLLSVLSDEEDGAGVEDLSLAAGKHLPPGRVEPILPLPVGDSPEGIALDKHGNIYVSNRRNDATGRASEILRITPDGAVSVFATLPTAAPEVFGVLGLITDPTGNVYAAHVTQDPATHGVYRIGRDGSAVERLAGSEAIILPNSLTFDARGALYVTDSFGGAVWRYGRDGVFTEWLRHPLLDAVPVEGAPFPVPGANGIAFYPPNKLYVANTSQFSITRIVIAPDGSAGGTEVVAQGFGLLFVDGIVVDVHGTVYGVLAVSNAEEAGPPPAPPLVKVDPRSGVVSVVVEDPSDFDAPTSLAFGRGARGRKSIFIVNSALFGPVSNGPGPGVVQVGVGVSGLPFQIDEPVPHDDMTLFVGEFAYAADPDEGFVSCLDPTGNSVPGLVLPKKANVDGRASHLDKTTGYFATSGCQAQADGSLTSAGDWMFIGADGHRVMGTWTATTLDDGSLTGKTVITGGIGSFADATGWTRFAGQIDLTTGTGRFYGKGLISSPIEVVEMGFVSEVQAVSESGSVLCLDRNGNATGTSGTRRFEAEGLATYLGEITGVIVNERCTSDASGVLTFYGTWTYTNAQGDGLQGTYKTVIGVGETWPNDLTITGGTGRFEGATGWMKGTVDPRIGIWVGELEGLIYMPR